MAPDQPAALPVPDLELVATITAFIARPVDAGRTGKGVRRIIPITGGHAVGSVLEGEIQPGGSDVQVVRGDGVAEIDARYVITTPRGTHVYVENVGVARTTPAGLDKMMRGEQPDADELYFRSTPRFETDDPDLAWLERSHFLATASPALDRVRIDVYRVG